MKNYLLLIILCLPSLLKAQGGTAFKNNICIALDSVHKYNQLNQQYYRDLFIAGVSYDNDSDIILTLFNDIFVINKDYKIKKQLKMKPIDGLKFNGDVHLFTCSQAKDGNYFIGGDVVGYWDSLYSNFPLAKDSLCNTAWICKTDTNFIPIWKRKLGGDCAYFNPARSYVEKAWPTIDGGVICLINSTVRGGDFYDHVIGQFGGVDCYLYKFDSLGNTIWRRHFGSYPDEGFNSNIGSGLIRITDTNMIFCPYNFYNDTVSGGYKASDSLIYGTNIFSVRTSDGAVEWIKHIGVDKNYGYPSSIVPPHLYMSANDGTDSIIYFTSYGTESGGDFKCAPPGLNLLNLPYGKNRYSIIGLNINDSAKVVFCRNDTGSYNPFVQSILMPDKKTIIGVTIYSEDDSTTLCKCPLSPFKPQQMVQSIYGVNIDNLSFYKPDCIYSKEVVQPFVEFAYLHGKPLLFYLLYGNGYNNSCAAPEDSGQVVLHVSELGVWPQAVQEYIIEPVKVYPNPTNNILSIEIKSNNAELQFFTLEGKLVFTKKASSNLTEIETANWAAGIYILKVVAIDKVYQSTKVQILH
jgi:hypothetical protein